MNILKHSALKETPQTRKIELRAMILTAIVLLTGLFFVYQVKTTRPLAFSEVAAKMVRKESKDQNKTLKNLPEIANLKDLKNKDDLLPYLTMFENEADRDFAAETLAREIDKDRDKISSVGFLGSRRVAADEIEKRIEAENSNGNKDQAKLDYFRENLQKAIARADERKKNPGIINGFREAIKRFYKQSFNIKDEPLTISILGGLGSLKHSLIVRTPDDFFNALLIRSLLFFGAFFGLHLFWRLRRFDGDGLILPPIFLLCGIGFLMMIGMRDPLRDTLLFADFASGAALGCLAVAVITSIDFQNLGFWVQQKSPKFADRLLTYAPIMLALLLSIALILFGSTPGASDAKVNLNIGIAVVQPSEIIKILFALFVAAYFSERWEYFRYLEKTIWRVSIPRVKDTVLLAVFVAALLILFFLQKDLGPALLMAGLFLVLFAVVRQRVGLSILGFLTIIGAYVANYSQRISVTAADRLEIWRDPWDTEVSGGDQIVHSLWSFATGGLTGTGFGLGDPYFAPAHHTDLILSSVGEELGFVGILFIFAAYGLLFYRCYVVANQTFSPFAYFLALGLGVINALQLLFIAGGVLGALPLSGVVTPFLSHGMSSMICNFVSFGIILAISSEKGNLPKKLAAPTKYVGYGFVVLVGLILFKAFVVQIWNGDEILVKGVLAPVRDEVINNFKMTKIRRYTYNPRIGIAKKELPIGTIYDRNGIPLASSNWDELLTFAEEYKELDVIVTDVCKKGIRCYPFGSQTFHLLGDANSEKYWSGINNFIEKDYQNVLRGYDDHTQESEIDVLKEEPLTGKDGKPLLDPETGEPISEIRSGIPMLDYVLAAMTPKFTREKLVILEKDYSELLPLIRNRYNPINISANLLKYKNRSIKTSIDVRLQLRLTKILKDRMESEGKKNTKGAIVVLEPRTGDLLASVTLPLPADDLPGSGEIDRQNETIAGASLLDRARYGYYPPGSTFKIVTEMAAMRKDPNAPNKEFSCIHLPGAGNRVGNIIDGQVVRDNDGDPAHGSRKFENALTVSCNAYFAQLGVEVGAPDLINIWSFYDPGLKERLKSSASLNLPQVAFGQGEIVATPFQIAKVAATVANGGLMEKGRWITDENNLRKDDAIRIITTDQASIIADAMRSVVADEKGTGRKNLKGISIQIAGKTGTAENGKKVNGKYVRQASHSWFMGFAPYNNPNQRIAFAVLVENGGYGGDIAAKITGDVVESAQKLRLIQ